MMLCKYIIFPRLGRLEVNRPEKFGGPVTFTDYDSLSKAYFSGELHPMDLKKGTADGISKCIEPVDAYFKKRPENLEAVREVLRKLNRL